VYYASIAVFGSLSVLFSFGDIENSKNLQIFTSFMRVFILGLFYLVSIINIAKKPHPGVYTDWSENFGHLSTVFGNTVFVFIYHHSIPGIVYPVRPQKKVRGMLLTANIVGAILLALEGQLAFWAFGGLTNNCKTFPCATQPLFNENFQNLVVIG